MLENTMVTKDCLHRFCSECITTALRRGNQECPTCRKKLVSRRCLRPDPNFDSLISKLFPGRKEALQQEQQNIQDLLQKHAQGLKENAAAHGVLSEPSEYSYAAMHTPRAKPTRKRKKQAPEVVEEQENDGKNSDKETESKADTESQVKKPKKSKKIKKVKDSEHKNTEGAEMQDSEVEHEDQDDIHNDNDDGYSESKYKFQVCFEKRPDEISKKLKPLPQYFACDPKTTCIGHFYPLLVENQDVKLEFSFITNESDFELLDEKSSIQNVWNQNLQTDYNNITLYYSVKS